MSGFESLLWTEGQEGPLAIEVQQLTEMGYLLTVQVAQTILKRLYFKKTTKKLVKYLLFFSESEGDLFVIACCIQHISLPSRHRLEADKS